MERTSYFSLNNNNVQFYNIIKNSGENFINKEELLNRHSNNLLLESNIKLRKDMEYEYNELKIKQLKEEIKELEFQKPIFDKRNQNILDNLESNSFKGFDLASRTNQSLDCLQEQRKKYQNYLDVKHRTILDEFIKLLFK